MSTFKIDILKDSNALIIFISQLMTSIADKMLSIGLIWYVTINLGALKVPWFLTCAFLPHLIFSFFSAKIIHHYGTVKTVMISEIFRGFVLLIYYFLLSKLHLASASFTYALFAMVFLMGIGSSIFTPAILSTPPILVKDDKIIALNALIDSSMSISSILGAVASIFLLNVFNLEGLILINAICFLGAYLLQLGLKPLKSEDTSGESSTVTSPIKVLHIYPDIKKMLLYFLAFNIVLTPIFVLIPWYVEQIYKGNSSSLATIEGAMGLGAFLMGIFISLTHIEVSEKNRITMIAIISFLFGVFFTAYAFTTHTWQGAVILFLIGSVSTFLNIQILTYFQTHAKENDIPAIMTAVNLISTASMPLSFVISGLILPNVNVVQFAMYSGFLVIVMALVVPKFMKG